MKISKRIFVFFLLLIFALLITWIHAYDVFYNNATSTMFGGDAVTYLALKYKSSNLEDTIKSILEVGPGSVFGLYGITLLSLLVNNIFKSWALYGSILINLSFVFISFFILEKSYSFQLNRYKKNFLFLTYIFPAIFIYIVGPNKEIFTFLASSILVRLASIASSTNKKSSHYKYELFVYFALLFLMTLIREIYLGIAIFVIPLFIYKSNYIRYLILYISTIIFYFIKPSFYYGASLMMQQKSSIILMQLEKYFDSPFTFIMQILGRYIVTISGVLYPARLSMIMDGHAFQIIRLFFFILIATMFFLCFKFNHMKLMKVEFSGLTKNLIYCLFMVSVLFCLSSYNSDRKIIPTYPIVLATISSLINDRNKAKTKIIENFKFTNN